MSLLHPIQDLLLFAASPQLRDGGSMGAFTTWLDKNIRAVVNGQDYSEALPLYEDNEETRKMLQAMSRDLQKLEVPEPKKLETLTSEILNIGISQREELSADDRKYSDLMGHILVNQLYDNGVKVDELVPTRNILLQQLAQKAPKVPDDCDMNKIITSSNVHLRSIFPNLHTNVIATRIAKIIDKQGYKAAFDHCISSYPYRDSRRLEAQVALAEHFQDKVQELINFVDSEFFDTGNEDKISISDDFAKIAGTDEFPNEPRRFSKAWALKWLREMLANRESKATSRFTDNLHNAIDGNEEASLNAFERVMTRQIIKGGFDAEFYETLFSILIEDSDEQEKLVNLLIDHVASFNNLESAVARIYLNILSYALFDASDIASHKDIFVAAIKARMERDDFGEAIADTVLVRRLANRLLDVLENPSS